MKKAVKKLLSSSLSSAKPTRWFIGSLLLMLTVTSCIKELSGSPDIISGEERYITLNMDIPYASTNMTRAIGVLEENTIEYVDVLAFKVNLNGDEEFEYHASAKFDAGHVPGASSQSFKAKIRVKSYEQRFVIIANARTQVEALLVNNWTGGLKDDMLKTLTVSLNNAGDKWNTLNIGNYTKFPMWGESGKIIIQSSTTDIGLIPMIRMIAKIDIRLNPAAQNPNLLNEFKLASVHLYNTSQSGRVVPSTAVGDWNVTDPSEPFAIKPSMPVGWTDAADRIEGPLAYTDFGVPGVPDQSMVGAIYTLEMPTDAAAIKRPCLVVGGYYYDPTTSTFDTDQSYYRLDFVRKSDGSFMPILRNHKYEFNIVNVKARGYPTVDEAFLALPVNIEVEVIDWNEGVAGDVVFDGQYFLAIRPTNEFEFGKNAETQTGQIKTDYPSGWEITKITEENGTTVNNGWLTTDKTIGVLQPSGSFVPTDLIVTLNDTGLDRIGYVYVKAGRMNTRIMVTQVAVERLGLTVTDAMGRDINTVTFDAAIPIDQFIQVNFEPKSANLNIEVTPIGMDPFNYGVGDKFVTGSHQDYDGSKNYSIEPPSYNLAIEPYVENISKVEFMVTDGTDYATKTIYLRQVNYLLTTDQYDYYSLNGVQQSLVVKSSATWEVKSVTGNEEILSGGLTFADIKTWKGQSATGNILNFTFVEDLLGEHKGKSIVIVLTDPSKNVPDYTVNLNALACGIRTVTSRRTVGSRNYITHQYGDKCWMVANTMEGSPSAKMFNGSPGLVNGYWYNYANAVGSCPAGSGWRLPNNADFTDMTSLANPDPNGIGRWWRLGAYGALSGTYTIELYKWSNWGINGFWYSGAGVYWQTIKEGVVHGPFNYSGAYFTARCIEE